MSIVLFIPGSVLALCGGALFKWHWGTLLVWVGQSIGQVIAFVIGRYLLRDAVVANVTSRYPKFAAIDAALEREGWRLVVMMRLSPIVPWNVLNYLLSITGMLLIVCVCMWNIVQSYLCAPTHSHTGVSFVSYSLASCAAVLPWLSLFTYLGSMATTAADVFSGQASPAGQTRVVVAVASGVLLVAAVVYTGIVAKYESQCLGIAHHNSHHCNRRAITDAFGTGSVAEDDDEDQAQIMELVNHRRVGAA